MQADVYRLKNICNPNLVLYFVESKMYIRPNERVEYPPGILQKSNCWRRREKSPKMKIFYQKQNQMM